MKWVVQTNLTSMTETSDGFRMEEICNELDYDFEGITVIPFSGEVPEMDPDIPTIPYGGTGWINNIYNKYPNHKGIFFNPESVFTYWIEKYKENALNYGAMETTFRKVSIEDYDDDELFFIRPVADLKEFAGCVMNFGDIKLWENKIQHCSPQFADIPIIIGSPYTLSHEWRLFILNGKVITGSQYRTYFIRNTSPEVPNKVIKFAEEQAEIYSPTDLFVMDVGQSAGCLYVIEIGCFNSAGFYDSNLETIIKEASKHVEKLYKRK